MEKSYDLSKINIVKKTREIKALGNKVKTLEKDLTFDKPLTKIKKILWANITQFVNDVWPSIQVIFEQIDLVKAAQGEIQKTRDLLGQMPDEANQFIHFLNNKTKEQLEELGISDRTYTMLEIKRVLTKRTLMQNLERRCQEMQVEVNSFTEKFTVLHQKGFTSLLGSDNRPLKQRIMNTN